MLVVVVVRRGQQVAVTRVIVQLLKAGGVLGSEDGEAQSSKGGVIGGVGGGKDDSA